MPSIFDGTQFPFDTPEGRELHLALCELYSSGKAAGFTAQKVGIQPWDIQTDQQPKFVWKDILEITARSGTTRKLIEIALQDYPTTPRREFFAALIANTPSPPLNHAAVKFRKQPEALLFHDDLTLPIGDVPPLIAALEKMSALAPAVCKLEVEAPGLRGYGTGFRISNDLLLTNWHVLYLEGNAPTGIIATFGYEGKSAGTVIECDPASVKASAADDWGIVKMNAPPDGAIPVISLADSAAPVNGAGAFVIQHPAGDRKRVAYARNHISYFDDEVVHYASDTQTGSSGAPVFDGEGRLIALHRAGGDPQELAGQTPIRMNEGVRITRVRQGLAQAGVNL